MPPRSFDRRVRHIAAALRLPLVLGAVVSAAAGVISVLVWVFEQVVGDAVSTLLRPYVAQLQTSARSLFPPLLVWVIDHPIQAAAILFVLVLSTVTVRAYAESRPLKGLTAIRPFNPNRPYGNLVGAIIHNNTGEDLLNCRCHLIQVRALKSGKWVDTDYRLPQELHWHTELRDLAAERIEIPSGTSACVIIAALDHENRAARYKVTRISDDYFEIPPGTHEAEIVFGANRLNNTSATQTFWAVLSVEPSLGLLMDRIFT